MSSGTTELYYQSKYNEEINWLQVLTRTVGGGISGAFLGNVGNQSATGAKEIFKNAAKVFFANSGVSFAENFLYNLFGGDKPLEAAEKSIAPSLLSGLIDSGTYTLGQISRSMCFVEGTLVLTAAGFVPIEEIEAGDIVIATDTETGKTAEKEVVETYVRETNELIHVWVNGEEIITTPTHPFYVPEKGWTDAIDLRAGDILVLVNGEYVTVEEVQHEILEEPVTVYNFQVADFHTYYVGEQSVLVHNANNEYKVQWQRMTNKESTEAASKLGFAKTNYRTKNGEPVYYNKKTGTYISQEIGSGDGSGPHNGGVWKQAKSPEDLNSKRTRMGTYDAELNRIGD